MLALDDERRRELAIGFFPKKSAARIPFQVAQPFARLGRDGKDFAVAREIKIRVRRDVAQHRRGSLRRRGQAAIVKAPDAFILRPEHPQRGTAHGGLANELPLIRRRDRVEKPHLVRAAFAIRIGVGRIQRRLVETHDLLGLAAVGVGRGAHERFVHGDGIRRRRARGPVVAEISDAHDELLRGNFRDRIGEHGGEPRLRRDRPRLVGLAVLVVSHEHDEIARRGNARERGRIVDFDLEIDAELQARGVEHLREQFDEIRQARQVVRREIFKVEIQAVAVPVEQPIADDPREHELFFRRTQQLPEPHGIKARRRRVI